MMLPPAAVFAAEAATASFNGMMPATGHLPTAQTGMVMMMNADDDGSAGWSSNSADVSNYLSTKPPPMVQQWQL